MGFQPVHSAKTKQAGSLFNWRLQAESLRNCDGTVREIWELNRHPCLFASPGPQSWTGILPVCFSSL